MHHWGIQLEQPVTQEQAQDLYILKQTMDFALGTVINSNFRS